MTPALLAVVAQALVLVPVAGIAVHFVLRRRRALAQAVPVPTADGLQIPVNAIFTHDGGLFGSVQRNSLRPQLAIGRDGVRFRAMTGKLWPFADIAHVEARPIRGGWRLIFVGVRSGSVLIADIIGEGNVLAALRALPDGLALTPQAALLRNGSATAGIENLRLYQGRVR